jgi:4a-hydroxytetrahydrobiopterin dehydratase
MPRLTNAEIDVRLKSVPLWTRDGDRIRRQFECATFPDAMAFLLRVGFDAEAADHHPDIAVEYRKVTLTFSTHSDGGLTEKDFVGAAAADKTAARFVSAGKAAGV